MLALKNKGVIRMRGEADKRLADGKLVPLAQMQSGESGRVAEIRGGYGWVNRLNALGIRPGKRITKISSMLMRGPITVQTDRIQVAVGFGIARKVMIRLEVTAG